MTFATQWVDKYVGMSVWLPAWRKSGRMGARTWARVPKTTLRRVKPAPKLVDREPISREMLATIMRATAVTAARRGDA